MSLGWTRQVIGEMPLTWPNRDGAQMVQLATGRILLIGGWSCYVTVRSNCVEAEGGGDRITNEVWKSDDLGATWSILLEHDPTPPTTGPSARFPPGHAIGVVLHEGHAVVMGNDASVEVIRVGDVWREGNRLWMFNGYNSDRDANLGRAIFSEDDGRTWQSFGGGAGGEPSHADATVVASGRILRISGNMDTFERWVWEFNPRCAKACG